VARDRDRHVLPALPGYALGERHGAGLICDALRMAIATRGGRVDGVIMHSDRGSEAFNSVLKVEYMHRHIFGI